MNSIRNHLSLLLLLGSGALCLVGGWLAFRAAHAAVLSEFDYSLRTKVHDFAALTEMEEGRPELEFVEKRMPEFERLEHPEYFQVLENKGSTLARSPSLGSENLARPSEPVAQEPVSYWLTLPGGIQGRAAALSVDLDAEEIIIVVARDTVHLKRFFRRLEVGFAGAVALLLLALATGLHFLVRRGLRPLAAFAREVSAIEPGETTRRFDTPSLPQELRPIAVQLDGLLERMTAALGRERYLTAAMAHELNTPVAELRIAAEVALKWPDDPGAQKLADSALSIALQMQDVVHALLVLSRCEAGLQASESEPVDPAELLTAAARAGEAQISAKNIIFSKKLNPGLQVKTDRAMLSTILVNLFRNAIEYTPIDGRIECRTERSDDHCTIILTNTQDTLTEEDLEHLFEPLWRKDKARTGSGHSGLGLAVAQRFCNLLGIIISASLPSSSLFRITLCIPFVKPDLPMQTTESRLFVFPQQST